MGGTILVTGGAGFIGSHLTDSLVGDDYDVCVVDNFDLFYDRRIKELNVAHNLTNANYHFVEADIRDIETMEKVFSSFNPEVVVHLAARAGVRPSLETPSSYIDVNVIGTSRLLDVCIKHNVGKIVFGSSSSVYGLNYKVPFCEEDATLKPASPYAATKIAGEALAKSYSNCYGIPIVALRFFTVYGPRQRPDLAIHKFARKILAREAVPLFGDGTTQRDYTFITDIVSGIRAAMDYKCDGYDVFNLGSDSPITLLDIVNKLESGIGIPANIQWLPSQTGDVPKTWADLTKSRSLLGFHPRVNFSDGIARFLDWLGSTNHVQDLSAAQGFANTQ